MRRRDFIRVVACSASFWPLAARAQADRVPLIGVAMTLSSDDPESEARLTAFRQTLQDLGWIVGRNVRIEYRWGAGDPERNRRNSLELVGLAPDVILATGSPTLEPLLRATRTVPAVCRHQESGAGIERGARIGRLGVIWADRVGGLP